MDGTFVAESEVEKGCDRSLYQTQKGLIESKEDETVNLYNFDYTVPKPGFDENPTANVRYEDGLFSLKVPISGQEAIALDVERLRYEAKDNSQFQALAFSNRFAATAFYTGSGGSSASASNMLQYFDKR